MSLTPAVDGMHVRTFESSRLEGLCVGDSLYLLNESDMTASCSRCCGPLPASIPSAPAAVPTGNLPRPVSVSLPDSFLWGPEPALPSPTVARHAREFAPPTHHCQTNDHKSYTHLGPLPLPCTRFALTPESPRGIKLCSSTALPATVPDKKPPPGRLPFAVSRVTPVLGLPLG